MFFLLSYFYKILRWLRFAPCSNIVIPSFDEVQLIVKLEEQRRYSVMKDLYVEGMKPAEICTEEGIEQRTYYRDIGNIKEIMGALIFGVDGLSSKKKR